MKEEEFNTPIYLSMKLKKKPSRFHYSKKYRRLKWFGKKSALSSAVTSLSSYIDITSVIINTLLLKRSSWTDDKILQLIINIITIRDTYK